MTKMLWVLEYTGYHGEAWEIEAPSPQFEEHNLVECLASDQTWALYEGEYDVLDAMCDRVPGWKVVGHPRAGKWVDAGGAEVFVDDDARVVPDAEAVVRSLRVNKDDYEFGAEEDAETIIEATGAESFLEFTGRVF